jgi:hypothetical protein
MTILFPPLFPPPLPPLFPPELTTVTLTMADLVGSATLVAFTNTTEGEGTTMGAA